MPETAGATEGLSRDRLVDIGDKLDPIRLSLFAIASDAPTVYAVVTRAAALRINAKNERHPFEEVILAPPKWRGDNPVSGLLALVSINPNVKIEPQHLDNADFADPVDIASKSVFYEIGSDRREGEIMAINVAVDIAEGVNTFSAKHTYLIETRSELSFGETGHGGVIVRMNADPDSVIGVLSAGNSHTAVVAPLNELLDAHNIELLRDEDIIKRNEGLKRKRARPQQPPIGVSEIVASAALKAASSDFANRVDDVKNSASGVRSDIAALLGLEHKKQNG